MKSTKCVECGFVGWSDVEHCKACGAPLGQRSHDLPSPTPVYNSSYDEPDHEEGPRKKALRSPPSFSGSSVSSPRAFSLPAPSPALSWRALQ